MGFVSPQVMNWDISKFRGKVKAKDIVETAKKLVPKMKNAGACRYYRCTSTFRC